VAGSVVSSRCCSVLKTTEESIDLVQERSVNWPLVSAAIGFWISGRMAIGIADSVLGDQLAQTG